MLGGSSFSALSGLALTAPWVVILIIPIILGLMLLTKDKLHEWYLMAGLLTLMPVVTGPIWFQLLIALSTSGLSAGEALVAVLPGVALTGIIVLRFRRCLSGPLAQASWTLLILSCMRWLNSFMIGAAGALHIDSGLFVLIGVTLPTVVAIVAFYLSGQVRWTVESGLVTMATGHDPKKR